MFTVLFQGDSITDCGRERTQTHANDPAGLGRGYAAMIARQLLPDHASDFQFYNRGVGGNRVTDLLARWRADAIHLRPNLISILIGVNDTWHKARTDTGTTIALYEQVYRLILDMAREELPQVRLVLCEPFGAVVAAFRPEWAAELKERSAVVRKLAGEYGATFIPLQDLFDQLAEESPVADWLPDGVHPSPAAHERMAAFWREHVTPLGHHA